MEILRPQPTESPFPLVQPPDWALESDGRLRQFINLPKDRLCILTVPGIGDFAWVWAKLWNLVELGLNPVFVFPDDGTRRVKQYADILGIDYTFQTIDIKEVLRYPGEFTVEEYKKGGAFYVHANKHLEDGKTLNSWHPELNIKNPISDKIEPWNKNITIDCVTVHMCMASYVEGNWLPRRWAQMIQDIERRVAPVRVVGALWDVPFAKRVFDFYTPSIEPCLDQPLEDSLHAIRLGKAHIGLDSGLTILAKYLGVPALQAFPHWLCDPRPTERHANGTSMPGTYDMDFHPNSQWCFVDELMDSYRDFLEEAYK